MVMNKSGFYDGWVISKNIILESEQELVWSHARKTWQHHDCFYTALVFHIPGWTLVLSEMDVSFKFIRTYCTRSAVKTIAAGSLKLSPHV